MAVWPTITAGRPGLHRLAGVGYQTAVMKSFMGIVLAAACLGMPVRAGDTNWPQFRGPRGDGIVTPPELFSTDWE